MPDTKITTDTITAKTALYALVRFCFSIVALVIIAISDLHNDKDSVPTIVYMLIGGLNGVDVYNLIQKAKNKDDSR